MGFTWDNSIYNNKKKATPIIKLNALDELSNKKPPLSNIAQELQASFNCTNHTTCAKPTKAEIKLTKKILKKELIYLDNNASTKIHEEVLQKLIQAYREFGNASAQHALGLKLRDKIETEGREIICQKLGCQSKQIIFSSGATESNNFILKGLAFANLNSSKKNILVAPTEHKSILKTVEYLHKFGFQTKFLKLDKNGLIDLTALKKIPRTDILMCIVMLANNETGVIQPIAEIKNILSNVHLHSDISQVLGKYPFSFKDFTADSAVLSAHKFNGPLGIGLTYFKNPNIEIDPLLHGGSQEYNKRAGTYNHPNILALAKAIEIAVDQDLDKLKNKRDFLENKLSKIFTIKINCQKQPRLYNTSSVTFFNITNIAKKLNTAGVICSTTSACTSHSGLSHVLMAMGLKEKDIENTIRFSLSHETSRSEINKLINIIADLT